MSINLSRSAWLCIWLENVELYWSLGQENALKLTHIRSHELIHESLFLDPRIQTAATKVLGLRHASPTLKSSHRHWKCECNLVEQFALQSGCKCIFQDRSLLDAWSRLQCKLESESLSIRMQNSSELTITRHDVDNVWNHNMTLRICWPSILGVQDSRSTFENWSAFCIIFE